MAAAYAHPNNRPGRGFIVGIIASIAFIFWLIAMTTPIAMVDDQQSTSQARLTVDPWHACGRADDTSVAFCRPMGHADDSCTGMRDMFRVEQAFLLLTGIMLFPLLMCAALDFSHKLDANTPDLPFHLGTHGWLIFFACVTALMSLIAFAVAFSIPRSDPCNNGTMYSQPNFEWGPSPVFSLLVFVCALAIIIVSLILREDLSVKQREEIMHPNQPVVHENEPVAPTPGCGPLVPVNNQPGTVYRTQPIAA